MIVTDNEHRTVTALESNVEGSDGALIMVRPRVGYTLSLQLTIAEIARILRNFDKRGQKESKGERA